MSGEHYASTQVPQRPEDCPEPNRNCKHIEREPAVTSDTADKHTNYYQCEKCDYAFSEVTYKDIEYRPGEAQRFA